MKHTLTKRPSCAANRPSVASHHQQTSAADPCAPKAASRSDARKKRRGLLRTSTIVRWCSHWNRLKPSKFPAMARFVVFHEFGDVWFSAVPKLITMNIKEKTTKESRAFTIFFGVSSSRIRFEDTTSTVMSSQPKRVFIWFDEFGRETSLFGSPNVRHTLCYTSGHVSLAAKAHLSSPNPQQASSFKGSHIFHMRKPRQIWIRSIQLLIKIHTSSCKVKYRCL